MNPSVFQKCTGIKNVLDKKSITISSHLFVSWYRKISRRSLLFFHFFRVSKFFQDYRGNSRFSLENFLFRSTKNVRRGTLLSFRKELVSKSFWMKSGPRFFSYLFVSRYRNISWGDPLVFHYFRVSKFFQHCRGNSRFSVEKFFVSKFQMKC